MLAKLLRILLIISLLNCSHWCNGGSCLASQNCCENRSCQQTPATAHDDCCTECEASPAQEDCCTECEDCCESAESADEESNQSPCKDLPADEQPDPEPSEPGVPASACCQGICGGAIIDQDVLIISQFDASFFVSAEPLSSSELSFFHSLCARPADLPKRSVGAALRISHQSLLF